MTGRNARAGMAAIFLAGLSGPLVGPLASQPALAAAPAAPPSLAAYGELPAVEDMAISPDGQNIAVVALIKGVRQLLVIDKDRKIIGRSGVGSAKMRGIRWAGNKLVLVTISSTENLGPQFNVSKIETAGVIILNTETGQTSMVFDKRADLVHAIFGSYGVREIGGKWYGFFGTIQLERSTGTRTNS